MMTKLREIRLQVVTFISKFEAYLVPAGKFITAMIVFCIINAKFGYMTKIAKFPIALILGLFCSFMPMTMIIIIAALLTLLHAYALSIEFAIVLAVVYMIMFLMFFRFSPKDSFAVIITPICFLLKIPYVVPMSFGLVGSAGSSVSVACGAIVYYVLKYMVKASEAIAESGEDDHLTILRAILEGLIKYKEMIICAGAFALVVLVVYLVRRMSINYAWTIAMIIGALTGILTILVGDVMYKTDISIVGLLFGTILACGVVKIIQFILFDVDYSKTEKVQFEDDDYYYYVKAVPKITAGNIKDNRDRDDSGQGLISKIKSRKPAEKKEEKPTESDRSSQRIPSAREAAERKKAASEAAPQKRRSASKPEAVDIDKEFSRERAAYEARQAEIARRREAMRRREERLKKAEEAEIAAATKVVSEEDLQAAERRNAYQRKKLEERLTRNDNE
ncbi:MAG: hypothetical protein J5856_04370 [Lachnospiraceae bacterium]|nr:hypothetical protein [Lachnospiraceae bacterium]